MQLRRIDPQMRGYTRRGRGRGFEYLDTRGRTITDEEELQRIRALAIPPAWTEVWICPDARGHIQAVGTDAAGRRQYRYHDEWRVRRDREKHRRMQAFAEQLPSLRRQVETDLVARGLPRERVLAGAVRMLDRASFRVGGETYAEQHGSYGLATIRKRHVHVRGAEITFDYVGKAGVRHVHRMDDPELAKLVRALKRRSGGGHELLAWKDERRWRDVRSIDINDYIKRHVGPDASAKDFRTWHATVLAAVLLAVQEVEATSTTSRKRQVVAVIRDVAAYLGNTPAVCRASYVDPRVIDRFMAGETIGGQLRGVDPESIDTIAAQRSLERAVLELLDGTALERVAA
jgi:DNA topoisomerase I